MGYPFERVSLRPRAESYAATQILDLCAVFEQAELFDLARNEFLAVEIALPMLEVDDTQGLYCIDSNDQRFEPNMPYEEYWKPSECWKVAPHHMRGSDFYYPEVMGGSWDQIAVSCSVRDRHFVKTWRRIAESSAVKQELA